MTWGSHCPRCGREDCEWTRGAVCEGLVREARLSRERCGWCHEYSPVGFHVPDEIWAQVVPERFRQTIACIRCFARMADERLVPWDIEIEFYPVSLHKHLTATGYAAALGKSPQNRPGIVDNDPDPQERKKAQAP